MGVLNMVGPNDRVRSVLIQKTRDATNPGVLDVLVTRSLTVYMAVKR